MSVPTPSAHAPNDNLVPVFLAQIGDALTHVCDARTLHAFLESGERFADWIKDRIEKYQLIENQDFVLISENAEIKKRGGDRRSKEYHLTLDTAKELAMVERNEKGRQIRRYFIDCERRAHGAIQPQAPGALSPELQAALSSKAHQLALQDYENILADMTERARQYGRMGCTDAEILQRLNREPFPRMGLIPAENLQPVLGRIGDLFNAVSEVMDRSLDPGSRRLS